MGDRPRLSERLRARAAQLGLTPAQIAALDQNYGKAAEIGPLLEISEEGDRGRWGTSEGEPQTATGSSRKAKTALPADRFGIGTSLGKGRPLPETEEARMIRTLVDAKFPKNAIARLLGGGKGSAYKRIGRALGELP